jgi:ribokinase
MLVVFGSINLDLIFPLPHLPAPGQTVLGPAMRIEPGGKGANQAVAAARDGARVVLAGAMGRDALAEDALELLRDSGVDISRVSRVKGTATGCAAICVDPQGRNLIAVASGANQAARQEQVEAALLEPSTTLLLQGETDLGETSALIARARMAGCRVVLNLAPPLPLATEVLRLLDVLVVNEDEAAWLARHLGCAATTPALHQALGIDVVQTLGAEGCEAVTSAATLRFPGRAITPIDTTGAGDCFTGVLAGALDRGQPLATALQRANAAAALACTRPGTQGSMPRAEEIDAALG